MPAPRAPPAMPPIPAPAAVDLITVPASDALSRVALNSTFAIHGFAAARTGTARHGVEIDHVGIRQNHGGQLDAQFRASFHTARALRFRHFAAHVGTRRNHHMAVHHHGEQSLKINRIAGPRAARGDSVVQHERNMRPAGNFDCHRLGRRGSRRRSAGRARLWSPGREPPRPPAVVQQMALASRTWRARFAPEAWDRHPGPTPAWRHPAERQVTRRASPGLHGCSSNFLETSASGLTFTDASRASRDA